jgi:hypothetical protein
MALAKHVRTEIRDRLIALLEADPDLPRVRKRPPSALRFEDLPCIVVMTRDETINFKTAPAPRRMERALDLTIEAWAPGEIDPETGEILNDPEGDAEAVVARVEALLASDRKLGGLVHDLTPTGIAMSGEDDDGEVPLGMAAILVRATYHAQEGAVTAPPAPPPPTP